MIPGSDSHVACLPDEDNCPQGHQCLQSGNVAGFYMCCTGVSSASQRRASPTSAAAAAVAATRASMGQFLTAVKYAAAAPKCPSGLHSNGQRCTVNEIEACPVGYVCLGGESIRGVCCKTALKCPKRRKPYYVANKQVSFELYYRIPNTFSRFLLAPTTSPDVLVERLACRRVSIMSTFAVSSFSFFLSSNL